LIYFLKKREWINRYKKVIKTNNPNTYNIVNTIKVIIYEFISLSNSIIIPIIPVKMEMIIVSCWTHTIRVLNFKLLIIFLNSNFKLEFAINPIGNLHI
jgi:hypothetical protein